MWIAILISNSVKVKLYKFTVLDGYLADSCDELIIIIFKLNNNIFQENPLLARYHKLNRAIGGVIQGEIIDTVDKGIFKPRKLPNYELILVGILSGWLKLSRFF